MEFNSWSVNHALLIPKLKQEKPTIICNIGQISNRAQNNWLLWVDHPYEICDITDNSKLVIQLLNERIKKIKKILKTFIISNTRVDPIIQKVIILQLHIMASMKSCSHRTFIKRSSMELNFYENFFYIMKRREIVCFKKLT